MLSHGAMTLAMLLCEAGVGDGEPSTAIGEARGPHVSYPESFGRVPRGSTAGDSIAASRPYVPSD